MDLDFSSDFSTFDNQSSVSIQSQDGGDPEVTAAVRHQVTVREAQASNGKYTTEDCVFRISGAELELEIQVGDILTEGTEVWTILAKSFSRLTKRWRLVCRQLVVNSLITIQKATYTKSEDGIQEAAWENEHVDLAASFQLISGTDEDDHKLQHVKPLYRVHLTQTIETANRRVLHNSNLYRIKAHSDSDRIDVLFAMDVEEW